MAVIEDALVVRLAVTDEPGSYPDAHGISIFHPNPRTPGYLPGSPAHYAALGFAQGTAWDEYLFALYPHQ
jgi:hypothetical protein